MKLGTISLSKLKNNTGQVDGLPKNPRFIKDEKFEKLKQSLIEDPEMMDLRELIVYDFNGQLIVICGNMRLRAMRELGYKDAPCKIIPFETDVKKLRAYAIKDNVAFGSDSWDDLANEWDVSELEDWGMDLPDFDGEIQEEKEQNDLSDQIEIGFKIEINCSSEFEQEKLYNELIERGIECRLLTL